MKFVTSLVAYFFAIYKIFFFLFSNKFYEIGCIGNHLFVSWLFCLWMFKFFIVFISNFLKFCDYSHKFYDCVFYLFSHKFYFVSHRFLDVNLMAILLIFQNVGYIFKTSIAKWLNPYLTL